MHCNSKIWNIDEKICFLEQKLFEHTKIIDELELSLKKLKVLPYISPKQPRKQSFFENNITLKKGKFVYIVNLYIKYTKTLSFFLIFQQILVKSLSLILCFLFKNIVLR